MKVRTGAILALGLALVASPGYAQGITFGAKIGANFSKVDQSTGNDTPDQKTGLAIGGFVEAPVAPQFSIQPEFLYSMRGAKDTSSTPEVSLDVNLIQIPVLAKYKFASKSAVHPFVYAGPGFGFVTSAKVKQDPDEVDIKDQVNTFDTAFILGGGVNIANFLVEVRYDWGLRDLDKDSTNNAKDRTFAILAGYSFGKKK